MPRKIVQLAIAPMERMGYDEAYREPSLGFACLCDDGSAWVMGANDAKWNQLAEIPTELEAVAAREVLARERAESDAAHADPAALPIAHCDCDACANAEAAAVWR